MSPGLYAALLDGAVLVTPNRRLARSLHRDFDLAQWASGKSAWPTPAILPYAEWLKAAWDEAVAAGAVADSTLLLSPAQSALQWQHVVDTDRAPLFDPRGGAALAAEAWSLLHEWGGGGESWRAWRRDADDEDDPAVFARWAEAYLGRLRAARACDLARAPDVLAGLGSRPPGASTALVFAGFIELTPQQERLLTGLGAAGAQLRRLDVLPAIDAAPTRTIAPTPRDELLAALAWARGRALTNPQARIGIVVEDLAARRAEVIALAEEVLCPGAILPANRSGAAGPAPFEVSLGAALASVPIVGAALDLIALAESSLAAGAAAVLLRSPYLPAADQAWARRAGVERGWLEEGRRVVNFDVAAAALGRSSPELAARWRAGHDALRGARRSSPREWADAWRAWLRAAGWPGSRALDSGEYQACEAWERLLGTFTSLGAVAPRLAPARALASLRSLAAETLFQPEGGAPLIQILGVLEATGLAFDALWVAGLAADRWPPAPSPNPLLPFAWQRERNVPHSGPRREREYAEALTARFARAAPEVVFSSAANADDHELSPSALILGYREIPAPARASRWSRELARGATLEKITDDRAPALAPGSRVRGGAQIVAAQSDCPFQAVARHRLGAEPWPAPCTGLSALERGSLAHGALAAFWRAVRDHATLVAVGGDAEAARIGAAVEEGLSELPAPRWHALPPLLRAGEAARLKAILDAWLAIERARPPFAVQAIESRAVLELAGIGLQLRLDRVDALEDGGLAIIDYKTGRAERPARWFDRRPLASQLGLYTLVQREATPASAVRAVAYAQLRPERIAALGLAADEAAWPTLESVAAVGPGGDWAELEAWWRLRLGALAAEIAAGHASVTPRPSPSPCRNCGLQALCRIESVRYVDDDAGDEQ